MRGPGEEVTVMWSHSQVVDLVGATPHQVKMKQTSTCQRLRAMPGTYLVSTRYMFPLDFQTLAASAFVPHSLQGPQPQSHSYLEAKCFR